MSNYNNLEEVLKLINNKYISLETNEVKHNNEILRSTLWDLIEIMKEQSTLFQKLFEVPYFGGSYYDDLKVGKPDEFDLDLLLVLPKVCESHTTRNCGCIKVIPSNKPGFFWFQVKKGFCAQLDKFIKDGHIQTDLVSNWLKSNFKIALNKLIQVNSSSVYDYAVHSPTYFSESGPALTLQLLGSFGHMNVDIVPAFKFGPEFWPHEGFRSNTTIKADFFIVPKKPSWIDLSEHYWRPSFQDQEKELIKRKEHLKPALRLLKKMRNNLILSSVSSYALKTIVLWEVDTRDFNWNESLSDTFIKLLEKYKEYIFNQEIPYYWNKNNNLLDCIDPVTLLNHHTEINGLLQKIKARHIADPCVIAKVILKEETTEYTEFILEFNEQNLGNNNSRISVTSSNHDNSYLPLNTGNNTLPTQVRTSYATGNASQQPSDRSYSGWVTAAGVFLLGIGAAVDIAIHWGSSS